MGPQNKDVMSSTAITLHMSAPTATASATQPRTLVLKDCRAVVTISATDASRRV